MPRLASRLGILLLRADGDAVAAYRVAGETESVCALDHVRWVGGGSGAGKTATTRLLAERFGLGLYNSDETIPVHSARLTDAASPLLKDFRRMSMDERWVLRDPATMYRTFPWFHSEGFDLLIEDLRALPVGRIVLVEGFRLLPSLVRPHLSNPRHALWLIPTPRFRQAAFAAREGADAFWLRTTTPQRALANLLERDRIFSEVTAAEARRNGLEALLVDGARTIEEMAEEVAERFDLLL